MVARDGREPVDDDEILFRRVSDRSGWYTPNSAQPVAPQAFLPNERDEGGLSVWRARYLSEEQAAQVGARADRRYYVLALRAGRLRSAGVVVEPSNEDGGLGHASLRTLSHSMKLADKNAVLELANEIAANLIEAVYGPFGPFGPSEESAQPDP